MGTQSPSEMGTAAPPLFGPCLLWQTKRSPISATAEHLFFMFCFCATVCKTVHTVLSDRSLSVLSVLSAMLVYCGQTVGRSKLPPGMEVDLDPGHIALDGDSPPKKGGPAPSNFSAHAHCGQMAGWIKMPLGTEAGLSTGDIVLDGHQAPQKGAQPFSNFRPMSVVAKRLDESRCYLIRRLSLGPGHIVLDRDPAPHGKGHSSPPTFRPMSIVAKRSPISATAELLFIVLICIVGAYHRFSF